MWPLSRGNTNLVKGMKVLQRLWILFLCRSYKRVIITHWKSTGKRARSSKPIQTNHLSAFNHTTVSLSVITASTGRKWHFKNFTVRSCLLPASVAYFLPQLTWFDPLAVSAPHFLGKGLQIRLPLPPTFLPKIDIANGLPPSFLLSPDSCSLRILSVQAAKCNGLGLVFGRKPIWRPCCWTDCDVKGHRENQCRTPALTWRRPF